MYHAPDPETQPEFYAGVPAKRLLAWLVDTVVIALLSALVVLLTVGIGAFFWPLLYLAVGFCYRWITIAANSATWGMSFAGIELRDAQGARLDTGYAFAHTLGYSLSIATFVIQAVSVFMMLTTARGQGLTDAFLGTVMINRRAAR